MSQAQTYYDEQVGDKLRDFVEGNARIERAWATIGRWTPPRPARILEVGCGVGHVCWRLARRFRQAEVVGTDFSPRSIEIARSLFGSAKLSFLLGAVPEVAPPGGFDFIVLMDVYEHLAPAERPAIHQALRRLRSPQGRIFLSFPTPRHQSWSRAQAPHTIQPIDEDIGVELVARLAEDTGTEVLLYQQVAVWRQGDYAHAVLGPPLAPGAAARRAGSFFGRLSSAWKSRLAWPRSARLRLVRRRLGLTPDGMKAT
jgi:SAM-dependent methyltransferase